MLPPNDYDLRKHYKLNRLPAVLAKAEQHRLLSEAGFIQRPWLSCQVFRSLRRLGRLLVTAGQRPERHYAPTTLSPASG